MSWKSSGSRKEERLRAGILLVVSLAGFGWATKTGADQYFEARWPRTDATIQHVEIKWYYGSGRHSGRVYTPVLSYEYQVDGKAYTGFRLSSLTPNNSNYEKLEERLGKYTVGKVVPVYYDPLNPTTSMLETDDDTTVLWIFFTSILMLGYSIYLWKAADQLR